MNKLLEKIVLDKLDDVSKLNPGERIDVRANQEMSSSMAENKLLSNLAAGAPVAPERLAMLQRVMEGSATYGGLLPTSWFSGRRLYLAAVLGVILCALAGGLVVWLVPGTSVAHSDGYMLVYDMGPDESGAKAARKPNGTLIQSGIGIAPMLCDGREIAMQDRLSDICRKRRLFAALRGETPSNMISISQKVDHKRRLFCIGLAKLDEKLLKQIKSSLAKVPGLPEPVVSDATWFSAGSIDPAKEPLSLVLGNRTLNFDPGFSEREVQDALNDWLKTNRPGFRAEVAFVQSAGHTDIQMHLMQGDANLSGTPQLTRGRDSGSDLVDGDLGEQLSLTGNERSVPAYGVGNH